MSSRPKLVYLAGPIDRATSKEAGEWRRDAAEQFGKAGVGVFDPSRAFVLQDPDFAVKKAVSQINRQAILLSGAVLAHIPEGVPAFGTLREVEFAMANKVAVMCVGPYIDLHVEAWDLWTTEDLVSGIAKMINYLWND